MERFFPGLTAELTAKGAQSGDVGIDCHWYVGGVRKPAVAASRGVGCTRPFLEWQLRRRATAVPGVRFVRAQATGLSAVDAGSTACCCRATAACCRATAGWPPT